MNIVVVESPAKAKTINKYLGPGYEVLASFGHIRDLPAKDGSVDPEHDFRMIWEVDAKSNQRINDIARALKGADKLILATDPDREGEAISWHVLEVLKEKKALKGQPVERVVFNAITKQSILEAMKHPRAIDAAWSTPISPAARSTTSSASPCRRCCGASCRAPARPAACNRWRCGWSATASSKSRSSSPANTGRSSPELATPRNEVFEARLVGADGKKITAARHRLGRGSRRLHPRSRDRRVPRRLGRGQARAAQSAAALHHLDHAAGGLAQARLLAGAYDAAGAAALRGHRHRRRDRRPHHLYANRRHRHGAGGDHRGPRHDRQAVRQGIRAGRAAAVSEQVEERPGSARSGAPDRSRPPARAASPRRSTAIRRASTS